MTSDTPAPSPPPPPSPSPFPTLDSPSLWSEPPTPRKRRSCLKRLLLALVALFVLCCICPVILTVLVLPKALPVGPSDYPMTPYAVVAEDMRLESPQEWDRHAGDGFALYLPQRMWSYVDFYLEFEAWKMDVEIDDIRGGELMMLVKDYQSSSTGNNVLVFRLDGLYNLLSVGRYAALAKWEMEASDWEVLDAAHYDLGERRVGRVIYITDAGDSGVQYALRIDGQGWVIAATTSRSSFDTWLPIYEEIARGFEAD